LSPNTHIEDKASQYAIEKIEPMKLEVGYKRAVTKVDKPNI